MNIINTTLQITSVSIQSDDYGMRAYVNSTRGRSQLESECTSEIVQQVYKVWGDTPTVEDPTYPIPDPQPSETDLLKDQIIQLKSAIALRDAADYQKIYGGV